MYSLLVIQRDFFIKGTLIKEATIIVMLIDQSIRKAGINKTQEQCNNKAEKQKYSSQLL